MKILVIEDDVMMPKMDGLQVARQVRAQRCATPILMLSAREFDMMRFLLRTGHRNISKATLLSRVWGLESNAVENHVEVYVGFLRKKLRSIGSDIRIEAIRRLGYHLEVEKS